MVNNMKVKIIKNKGQSPRGREEIGNRKVVQRTKIKSGKGLSTEDDSSRVEMFHYD